MIRALTAAIVILSLAYLILAFLGGFYAYSPVPFWDMFNGYLDFYVNADAGNWAAWWAQHNEHRILLSRILFWIDNEIFSGRMIFLIVVNYFLIILACVVYKNIIASSFKDQPRELGVLFLLVAICLLFSWTQSENITWGFQSQFFLAQLLPLIAFYLLYESERQGSVFLYTASCLIGILACISMANGITALPVLVLLAIVMRVPLVRIGILIVLSVASISLYFHGYVPPAHHGSLATALTTQPLDVIKYVLLYLGAPLYYMTGKGPGSHLIAQLGGLFLIASSAYFLFQTLNNASRTNIKFVLLAFLLYIGGSALATAGGRVVFGIEQALAGRYMTPVLMAWIALALLYAEYVARSYIKKPILTTGAFLLVQLLFLPSQLHALDNHQEAHFQRLMAALALEVGVDDKKKIEAIFPSYEWAKRLSTVPAERNISIFGHPLISDIDKKIGLTLPEMPGDVCQGALDETNVIPNDNNFISIRGWIFNAATLKSPKNAFLINAQQKIVGYVLVGAHRPDVKSAVHENAEYAGFEGYGLSGTDSEGLKLVSATCYLPVSLPQLPYVVRSEVFGRNLDILSVDEVVNGGTWAGLDYYRSEHEALNVYGSYVNSDSDTGYIKLRVSDGDSFYYRSGPSNKGQLLRLGEKIYNLPLSTEWVLLTLLTHSNQQSEVVLEDAGNEWGQWSAIALKK